LHQILVKSDFPYWSRSASQPLDRNPVSQQSKEKELVYISTDKLEGREREREKSLL